MKYAVIAFLTLNAAAASALSLKEQKEAKYVKDYMADESKGYKAAMKKNCGFDLPTTVDEKMIPVFMAANRSLVSYCDTPRSTLASMCEDATSKESIVKNVKRTECKLGKKDELSFKLEKGTLIFTTGTDSYNHDAKLKEWLENNLK